MFLGENSIFFVADEAITDANYTQVINKLCNMYFAYTFIKAKSSYTRISN